MTTETALEAFKRVQKENNDEIKFALKLQELIKKRIDDIGKHESLHGVFNDYVKPELQELLKESKK